MQDMFDLTAFMQTSANNNNPYTDRHSLNVKFHKLDGPDSFKIFWKC